MPLVGEAIPREIAGRQLASRLRFESESPDVINLVECIHFQPLGMLKPPQAKKENSCSSRLRALKTKNSFFSHLKALKTFPQEKKTHVS